MVGGGGMDEAEVIDHSNGYWVVVAHDRRYYLREEQFTGRETPRVGLRGRIGYVQGLTTKTLTFTDHEDG